MQQPEILKKMQTIFDKMQTDLEEAKVVDDRKTTALYAAAIEFLKKSQDAIKLSLELK